jgi:hypothetical protein
VSHLLEPINDLGKKGAYLEILGNITDTLPREGLGHWSLPFVQILDSLDFGLGLLDSRFEAVTFGVGVGVGVGVEELASLESSVIEGYCYSLK